jgi:undecaprenyl-diphosphatase
MTPIFLASLLQKIIELDQWIFIQVNTKLANPFFDSLMPFMRTGTNWAPLYLFMAVFVLLNFKGKGAWWMLFFVCTVALTDMGGTNLFKHNFGRDRPCADPEFYNHVRLLVNCVGRGNSFISNHAANHFGMAMFFFVTFRHILKKWAWLGFAWAACIAFAQVYVGIHFPFDVLSGALFGCLIGLGTGTFFNKRFQFVIFDNQSIA